MVSLPAYYDLYLFILRRDVVNESLNDDGTFGASPFLSALGSGYIFTAFKTARAADPAAKLYIVSSLPPSFRIPDSRSRQNDFNTEGVGAKSNALLTIVQNLTRAGLIDGVGFQSHFIVGEVPTTLQANLQRFANAGVDVAITELDVRMTLPATAANVAQQAKDYTTVINACKAVARCVGVTTWGASRFELMMWAPC